ncbi:MAG: hypothetical protein DRP83_02020 [Planctomycetota bacterium]|nr:MAG: hypothetical protein DRP83_02020 [Planctomycetota bacterium]
MAEETNAESQESPGAEEILKAAGKAGAAADGGAETVETKDVQLPQGQAAQEAQAGQINILLRTSMPVEVRLGDVDMEVRDLLQLGPGSIITLEKRVGDPLDLYLKGIRFAIGQLVVTDDMLGVRVTRILPRRRADRQVAPTPAPPPAPQPKPEE